MKYLSTYKLFESSDEEDFDTINNTIVDILQDCSDNDIEVHYYEPSEFYIKQLEKEAVAIRINLYSDSIPAKIKFSEIKLDIDHLISYMKSIGYSNYFYYDDETDFNLHNRSKDSDIKAKQNYLPTDDYKVGDVKMTFIKDIQPDYLSESYKGINGIDYRYEWALPTSKIRRNLTSDLNSILLEASDLDYKVSTGWLEDPYVWIGSGSFTKKVFNYDEISDTIERIKNYLISEGFEIREFLLTNQIHIYFKYKMNHLKEHSLFEGKGLEEKSREYIRDIAIELGDIGAKMAYQEQDEIILMYIASNDTGNKSFLISEVQDNINHIISFMKEEKHPLVTASYRYKGQWFILYHNSPESRWYQLNSTNIFDLHDLDTNIEITSFELRFKK